MTAPTTTEAPCFCGCDVRIRPASGPSGAVLASWPAWLCPACGSRYLHDPGQCCGSRPDPVTVTITPRGAAAA